VAGADREEAAVESVSVRAATTDLPARPLVCAICGATGEHRVIEAREMMLGLRDRFEYFECGHCGCVQIVTPPSDLSKYYPPEYYSFTNPEAGFRARSLKDFVRRQRDRYALVGKGWIGAIAYQRYPRPAIRSLSRVPGLTRDHAILDVGCGSGALVRSLHDLGFSRTLGVDPFIPGDLDYPNGARVLKQELDSVTGTWDLIMFHDSFEHMPEPARVLSQVARMLTPAGECLIRMPTVSSYAWEHYGANWAELDAPRHLFLQSRESLRRLAEGSGLRIREIHGDSDTFQFWGSEQYLRDIPLSSDRSWYWHPKQSIFTPSQIADFRRRAAALDADGRGSRMAVYLQLAADSRAKASA